MDTAEAKHAAAVLLGHLRTIKEASGHGATFELNQAGNYAGGPETGNAFSWFGKNQAAVNGMLVNPLNEVQLKALREYQRVHAGDANSSHGKA